MSAAFSNFHSRQINSVCMQKSVTRKQQGNRLQLFLFLNDTILHNASNKIYIFLELLMTIVETLHLRVVLKFNGFGFFGYVALMMLFN